MVPEVEIAGVLADMTQYPLDRSPVISEEGNTRRE
jgi:hypothetical protein